MDGRHWMNDADLAAAASLFQCNILLFNIDKNWQCYSPETFKNGTMNHANFNPNLPTLLMENSKPSSNDPKAKAIHYNPVVNVRK